MELVAGIIVGIIVLTLLVVVHEFGHALVARRHGVVVEEFGIGFPPRAYSKTLKQSVLGKNVRYSINWLPLGGFVKLQGESDDANGDGDYGAATFWQKTQILLAGVVMNWLTAAVLLTILAAVGLPRVLPNQFVVPNDVQSWNEPVTLAAVTPDSPAEKAGLKPGDRILRFDGKTLDSSDDLKQLAKDSAGKSVEIIYSRQQVENMASVQLRSNNDEGKGYLGASSGQQEYLRSSWSAPIVGVGLTAQMTGATLQGLGDMIVKGVSGLVMQFSSDKKAQQTAREDLDSVGNNVAGPVGIFGVIFPAAQKAGLLHVTLLAAIISLTLATMNILPIPALDGGRWFVTALFRAMRKPLHKETEEKIHGTGFMVLMLFIILVTIADIGKF